MSGLFPHERAMIDAAIAAGRVTVVPRGVSGIPLPVWDDKLNGLRMPDGAAAYRAQVSAGWRGARNGRPSHPDVTARRERVAALHADGLTVAQIIAATGLHDSLVRLDLATLKLRAHPARVVAGTEVRDRIGALVAEGRQTAEIAGIVGLSVERVYRLGRELGAAMDAPARVSNRDARRQVDAAVAACVAEGLDKPAIRSRMGITHARLRQSLARQGLTAPDGKSIPKAQVERGRQRARDVLALAAEGKTRLEIAAATGLHEATVRDIARKHQITLVQGKGGRPRGPALVAPATALHRPLPADDLRRKIGAMHAEGLTWRAIADATGLTTGTVGYHLRMLQRMAAPPTDPALLARAAELRAAGATARMVANVLGVGLVAARAILREAAAMAQGVAA
jgi:DNA-binding CsgD family transcriptional regulator